MVQVINDPHRNQSFGSSLATGLGSALEGLVSHKVGQLKERQGIHALKNAFTDLPEATAAYISKLPAKEQVQLLQSLSEQSRQQQMQQQPDMQEQEMMKYMPEFLKSEESKQAFTPEEHAKLSQQFAQQQPQQQNPSPNQEQPQGVKLSQIGSPKGVNVNVKLSPENQAFIKKSQTAAEYADEITPLLDEVEDILSRGQFETGTYSALKASINPALLEGDTQLLHNTLQNILTKQTSAESQGQGRGSDLLRKMIAEGKLSLGQSPENLESVIKRLRKDIAHKKMVANIGNELVASGKVPSNLSEKARQLATHEEEKFERLADDKKVQYLLDNPQKMLHIRSLDLDGKKYYRDENNNWVEE